MFVAFVHVATAANELKVLKSTKPFIGKSRLATRVTKMNCPLVTTTGNRRIMPRLSSDN